MENIEYKELKLEDINDNLLDNFNRFQNVKKWWKNINGNLVLVDEEYTVDWDEKEKYAVVKLFVKLLTENEGVVFGAYDNKKLIGFSVLLNNKFGTIEQYVELEFLHISLEYRHKGIGKILFKMCMEKAKKLGAEKIYISANDSEETQKFYLGIGCKDAIEINKKCVEKEPYDRQMEYKI